MIAVELTAEHWFYLYIVWFYPLLLPAIALGSDRLPGGVDSGHAGDRAATATPAR